jgi:hypothetical protein
MMTFRTPASWKSLITRSGEAFARAFVMSERAQVRNGQSQLLAVEGCPVLKYFLLVEVL